MQNNLSLGKSRENECVNMCSTRGAATCRAKAIATLELRQSRNEATIASMRACGHAIVGETCVGRSTTAPCSAHATK